jgi:3-deoxy-manno-octulosonate cytidylyltransferase (CMP-KDO synthetase)
MIRATGIIPARYASTRFPGKPLIDLAGKSMLQRVYEQCKKSKALERIIIATDDERIYDHALSFGAEACLTDPKHPSGTDRCAEVSSLMKLSSEVVVNIQGDEPLIDPQQITDLIQCFNDPKTQIATLIKKIEKQDVLFNVNTPKVIIDSEYFAIYFSRETIPHLRNIQSSDWLQFHTFYQHIGIYAYHINVLSEITQLPPSTLEKAESLEQLRWLEHQYKIKTACTDAETYAIDTPEDVQLVLDMLNTLK